MGRAVSALLFCVAMDPVCVNLNTIPRVLSVKGYMDDNATCGLQPRVLSPQACHAGFHVLGHYCIDAWPGSSVGHPSSP